MIFGPWGIVSDKESDAWITGGKAMAGIPRMRVSELLRAGRAGLRVGNALTLKSRAQTDGVWPTQRINKLRPEDDMKSTGAALNRCTDTIMSTLDAASVAREIVDDLFPVAQGIYESAPMSFCLRFSIEYTRMRMLKGVRQLAYDMGMDPVKNAGNGSSSKNWGSIEDEIMQQKSVLDLWKGKCESQLNMLAVCKSNGIFDMIPSSEFAYDCPFTISTPYASKRYYVTPQSCLLYYSGEFFNPCRHSTKMCKGSKPSFTVDEIVGPAQRANTLIGFDARGTGSGEILGTWPTKFYDLDASKNDVAVQVVERILRWQVSFAVCRN